MKCEKCNDIINFDSENICKKILKEAKKIWFKVSNHSIWIYWTCKKCCQTKAILK
jgi:Fe2+ or Zn2+ uptake regulation protein